MCLIGMQDPVKDLLHYAKHGKNDVVELFEEISTNPQKWCPFNHESKDKTNFACYLTNNNVKDTIEFLEIYKQLFSYLEINPGCNSIIEEIIRDIKNPRSNPTLEVFKRHLEYAKQFLEENKNYFYEQAKKFTCIEARRLMEGMLCLNINCFFASTIMATSAVESRLHSVIRERNKTIYMKNFKDSMLGKILAFADPKQYNDIKYSQMKKIVQQAIPSEHLSLIHLLNRYRIASAHPKEEDIDYNIAHSIIHLSFALVLDPRLSLPKKSLVHGKAPAK